MSKSKEIVIKKSKAKAKEAKGEPVGGPPIGATSYSGPMVIRKAKQGMETLLHYVNNASVMTSSAGGDYTGILSSDCHSVSGFLSGYDRYRVLAMEVWYEPHSQFNPYSISTGTNVLRQAISVVGDLDDATATLTGHAAAMNFSTWQLHNLARPFHFVIKASGTALMTPVTTASAPPTLMGIKFYAGSTLSASTQYGYFFQRWLVQFFSQDG
jgi:hypothetical protein